MTNSVISAEMVTNKLQEKPHISVIRERLGELVVVRDLQDGTELRMNLVRSADDEQLPYTLISVAVFGDRHYTYIHLTNPVVIRGLLSEQQGLLKQVLEDCAYGCELLTMWLQALEVGEVVIVSPQRITDRMGGETVFDIWADSFAGGETAFHLTNINVSLQAMQ